MKKAIDYAVIADFLSPSVKERIIHELSSPKKRMKAFERFSHGVDSIINSECIYYKGKSVDKAVKAEIKNSSAECTLISLEHELGKVMSIDEAFDYLSCESTVVLCVIGNWLIIKPEYERGEELYYVLKKQ